MVHLPSAFAIIYRLENIIIYSVHDIYSGHDGKPGLPADMIAIPKNGT